MTSTPLIWEERPSDALLAERHGFTYEIKPDTIRPKTVWAIISLDDPIQWAAYDDCSPWVDKQKMGKDWCQVHADAIAGAIADAVSEERKLIDGTLIPALCRIQRLRAQFGGAMRELARQAIVDYEKARK